MKYVLNVFTNVHSWLTIESVSIVWVEPARAFRKESDTLRVAGGLVSGAASKAVVPLI